MIATLTPDRGDRPEFMDFCNKQLSHMKSTKLIVDYKPFSSQFDLVSRVRKGIEMAKELGIDKIVMVESDDFYPSDYLHYFDFDKYDFIGWGNTTYYNIRQRTWQRNYHGGPDGHSSLCATGFRISALEGFKWPADDNLWLDIAIWKFARQRGIRVKLFETDCPVIGIKHGVGRFGGKGHVIQLKNRDPELKHLKTLVSPEAFEFYSNLKL